MSINKFSYLIFNKRTKIIIRVKIKCLNQIVMGKLDVLLQMIECKAIPVILKKIQLQINQNPNLERLNLLEETIGTLNDKDIRKDFTTWI